MFSFIIILTGMNSEKDFSADFYFGFGVSMIIEIMFEIGLLLKVIG